MAALVSLLAGCANIGNPSGGPRDEDPPRLVSANPPPGSLGVNRTKMVLQFDELVNVGRDAFSKVVVSPPPGPCHGCRRSDARSRWNSTRSPLTPPHIPWTLPTPSRTTTRRTRFRASLIRSPQARLLIRSASPVACWVHVTLSRPRECSWASTPISPTQHSLAQNDFSAWPRPMIAGSSPSAASPRDNTTVCSPSMTRTTTTATPIREEDIAFYDMVVSPPPSRPWPTTLSTTSSPALPTPLYSGPEHASSQTM